MTAKPTMPSAPGDPDSTNRTMAAATPALAKMQELPETQEDTGRRPYQPPRIIFREPLEAMAAICTPPPPAKANKGLCPMGPISS